MSDQNAVFHVQVLIGTNPKTFEPMYKDIKVVTTNTKVICYNSKDEEIGQAGVLRKSDFNFDKLFKIALSKSELAEA